MMGSIPIPNTRFYLTSIDGKKWFVTEYYRTSLFNPDKETYDLYKAFAEAFRKNEIEEQEFQEELEKAVNKAYSPCAGKAHSVRGGMKGALEILRNS